MVPCFSCSPVFLQTKAMLVGVREGTPLAPVDLYLAQNKSTYSLLFGAATKNCSTGGDECCSTNERIIFGFDRRCDTGVRLWVFAVSWVSPRE